MTHAFVTAVSVTYQQASLSSIPFTHHPHLCPLHQSSNLKPSKNPSRRTIKASTTPETKNGTPKDATPSGSPRRRGGGPGASDSALFGIRLETNGDVLKFGVAALAAGYLFKTLLQVAGVPDLLAGQITTGVFGVTTLVGWVLTYVFRVGTKGMTYAQQLRDYEDEVIRKRYEELSEEELSALAEEIEDEE